MSYSMDTVRAVRELYPDAELFFIIGEDNVAYLPRCIFRGDTPQAFSLSVRRQIAGSEDAAPPEGWWIGF